MAITGLSEFSFGFAFLFEQTNRHWPGVRAAPVLPSLRQEADDAWDARLPLHGLDYYYQFKLTDYLFNWNAKYIADRTYQDPYYRIALHARDNNRQHRRLREQCADRPHTYYESPELETLDEFNTSFLGRHLTENSRLIPLTECDDIAANDGRQHYITYQPGDPAWIQHSEPKRHEWSTTGKQLEGLYRESRAAWKPLTRPFARELFERTADKVDRQMRKETGEKTRRSAESERESLIVSTLMAPPPRDATRTDLILRTADLVSVFFGLTMVLVGEANDEDAPQA